MGWLTSGDSHASPAVRPALAIPPISGESAIVRSIVSIN